MFKSFHFHCIYFPLSKGKKAKVEVHYGAIRIQNGIYILPNLHGQSSAFQFLIFDLKPTLVEAFISSRTISQIHKQFLNISVMNRDRFYNILHYHILLEVLYDECLSLYASLRHLS